jgi:hypothetical protein
MMALPAAPRLFLSPSPGRFSAPAGWRRPRCRLAVPPWRLGRRSHHTYPINLNSPSRGSTYGPDTDVPARLKTCPVSPERDPEFPREG